MQARNYVKFPSTHFFKHLCYILKQFQNLIVLSGVIDYDEGERRKLAAIDIYQLSGKGEIPSAKIHDGAILTLIKQVEWGDHVRPVCLPYNPNIEKLNKNLEIAGWGQRYEPPPSLRRPTVLTGLDLTTELSTQEIDRIKWNMASMG